MKLITGPIHLAWRALVLPVKVIVASVGLTFRAGLMAGRLPVKGGVAVSRALGWKIVGALVLGTVLGFVAGRQFTLLTNGHDHDHDHDHDHGLDEGAGVAA